ncbi:hypothetical protein GQ457_10G010910 [Hibiscus cannabinus]
MERGRRSQIVTLFVGNLPPSLHWRGLRHSFGHHGDVVDSFIANKRDRNGRRFGFVRFSNRRDANRALERLNGFRLFGWRISVSFAKYKDRTTYWKIKRNTHPGSNQIREDLAGDQARANQWQREVPTGEAKATQGSSSGVNGDGGRQPCDTAEAGARLDNSKRTEEGLCVDKIKRIKGHVDDEQLWKCSHCLVGTMAVFSNSGAIMDRLNSWGLGEIKVKHIGGYQYLIEIKDNELFKMLEDLHWSYLKEVFIEVIPWTVSFKPVVRMTWIMIFGLPVHCWNNETLKNMASLWGNLEGLGENANQSQNCESVSVLIATNQVEFINEIVGVEIGSEVYYVRVSELCPWIIGSRVLKINEHPSIKVNSVLEECSSEEVSLKNCSGDSAGKKVGDSADTFNALFVGKEDLFKRGEMEEPAVNSLGEMNINGGGRSIDNDQEEVENANYQSMLRNGSKYSMDDTTRNYDVDGKSRDKSGASFENWVDPVVEKTMEDLVSMGFNKGEMVNGVGPVSEVDLLDNGDGELRTKKSWAEIVHQNLTLEKAGVSGKESKKSKRRKKYGSMQELQDSVLSLAEKRKRDVALKKLQNKSQAELDSEIENRSLSDSDLKAVWSRHLKDARKSLKLGKKLGIQFIGDEEEVLKEISSLERRDFLSKEAFLWPNDDFEFCWSAANGHSGGLLSVWDKSKFQLERVIKFDRFIVIEGVWNWEKLSVSMVNVYDPCEAVAQDLLWDNLLAEKSGSNRVWILAGVFNAIRFRNERKGCVSKVKVSSAFNNFIEKGDLQEVKLVGRRFTWFGPTGKRSLLDRFLVSDSWLQNQSDLVVQALQRSVSDHVPLLLSSLEMDWGPIPFKFFNVWLQVEECTKTITDSLRDPKMVDRVLPEKLKEESLKQKVLAPWKLVQSVCGSIQLQVIFSGPVQGVGADFAELMAIKTALDVFVETGWYKDVGIIIESDSKVVLYWVENQLSRPWHWWETFDCIDRVSRTIGGVQFRYAPRTQNGLADYFTKSGLNRSVMGYRGVIVLRIVGTLFLN